MMNILKDRLHKPNRNSSFINEALKMLTTETLIETYLKDSEAGIEVDTFIHKLPVHYFDFFTKVNVLNYLDQNVMLLEFYRPYSTHYFFSSYTEIRCLLERILNFFGYQDDPHLELIKNKFIDNTKEHIFQWKFDFGVVQLLRNPENDEPKLIYVVEMGKI